jgi:hypothetical protein
VRYLRRFLLSLALLIALAALLASLVFIPGVQTRLAQATLDRHPGLRASLGALSAGPGGLEAHDLTLAVGGATLSVPSLQARLPLVTALWDQTFKIETLTAKGWMLDFRASRSTKAAPPTLPLPAAAVALAGPPAPPPIPALTAVMVVRQLLAGLALPPRVSIDAVDLEGDIVTASASGSDPIIVHALLKGGGMAAGREGTFAIEVTAPLPDTDRSVASLNLRGQLVVALDAAGRPGRLDLAGGLAAQGRTLPAGLHLAVHLAAASPSDDESLALGLTRGERKLASLVARFPAGGLPPAGSWQVDARDSDVTPVFPATAFPSLATTGAGTWETDATLAVVHAAGRLDTTASQLGPLARPLDRLGTITLRADFALTHSGHALRFDQFSAALRGDRPVATARSLQPFTLDESTGALHPADPGAAWLDGTLPGLPLAWILGAPGGLAFAGGDATGGFVVRAAADGFEFRTKSPLTARGVTVRHGERELARGLDLSFPIAADFGPDRWTINVAPLVVTSGGRKLATAAGTVARGSVAQQIKVSGTWDADLHALATAPGLPAFKNLPGRSASGDFSAIADTYLAMEGKLVATGGDPTHTVNASLRLRADPHGRYSFAVPLKISFGPRGSEFSVTGTWPQPAAGGQASLTLSGENVAFEHLALLAAPLSAAGWVSLSPTALTPPTTTWTAPGVRDAAPFWGDTISRVSFEFGRLTAGGHTLTDVGGTFFLTRDALQLDGGRATFHHDRMMRAQGTLTFDAAADRPYRAAATASADGIEAALLLGPTHPGREPWLRGNFAVTASLAGRGLNLPDVINRANQEFHFTSQGGSTRLLQASVAASLTEKPTPVSDALGTIGSVFGALLKTRANVLQAEKNPVSPQTDAVLNFTYATQEFRYDQFSFTAGRGADRRIRIIDLKMSAPGERLTGTGQIDYVPGQPLANRPLRLELHLAFASHAAAFLTSAGLLTAPKDAEGFAPLPPTIAFGGTLGQIDATEWNDLLVRAATPASGKKGN